MVALFLLGEECKDSPVEVPRDDNLMVQVRKEFGQEDRAERTVFLFVLFNLRISNSEFQVPLIDRTTRKPFLSDIR